MSQTANLQLPRVLPAQAQKHVPVNESLARLDGLVQLSVQDKDLAAPPPAPQDGQRWIVAANPAGAWANRAGQIAQWTDGAWLFVAPREGFLAWVADEDRLYRHDGAGWAALALSALALLLAMLAWIAYARFDDRRRGLR